MLGRKLTPKEMLERVTGGQLDPSRICATCRASTAQASLRRGRTGSQPSAYMRPAPCPDVDAPLPDGRRRLDAAAELERPQRARAAALGCERRRRVARRGSRPRAARRRPPPASPRSVQEAGSSSACDPCGGRRRRGPRHSSRRRACPGRARGSTMSRPCRLGRRGAAARTRRRVLAPARVELDQLADLARERSSNFSSSLAT